MIGRALRAAIPAVLVLAAVALMTPAAAAARSSFNPRIGRALGLVAPAGAAADVASGTAFPEVYHGGSVMTGGVTIHTIFWAPSGYAFDGSPAAGVPAFMPLIQQFFTDVAHDSGSTGNLFSILDQYGDTQQAGSYAIAYSAAADSIDDSDPYPRKADQCASPDGVATCITDTALTIEVDKVIAAHDPSGRDLHNIWEVFLPPNVDECYAASTCGTNAFAGYHSLADAGHGRFIYAVVVDAMIETPPTPGADPEGNPEAESAIDTAAHETVESITDPEGAAWMDPNGFEVADKCESGLQQGTPLGFAADGSPYDQLINGHEYDIQEMWSNAAQGCVQGSPSTADGLPLPSVTLRQFSPLVSGTVGRALAGVRVAVDLLRAGDLVASAAASTRADGSWGPVALRSGGARSSPHALGDDRDIVVVANSLSSLAPEVIETGSGGSPYTEAGWTGWLDLDTGAQVDPSSVSIAPCFQTGVLGVTVNSMQAEPALPECSTEEGETTVQTPPITAGSKVTLSSSDNRAVSILDPAGALVDLVVALGEPGSVPAIGNQQVSIEPTGIPACTANLSAQTLRCDGLVPFARYTVTRWRGLAVRHAVADGSGVIGIARFPGRPGIARGDRFTLSNGDRRTLTVLHVADLRVDITGDETVLSGGRCQPGDYWGAQLTSLPASASVGVGGAAGTGTACPASGSAARLTDAVIAQTDDLSGGLTETSVPLLVGTAPANDAIISGPFTALAQTGLPGADGAMLPGGGSVSLTITHASGGAAVFHAANVASGSGAAVPALPAGIYRATWTVRDANGDTRTVHTTFLAQ